MRIKEKALKQYPFFIQPFFWRQKKKYGQVLKPGMLWGRSPWLFATVAMLYGALDRRSSPLNPVLRSLVTVRVSQINWCEFCVDINSNTLLQRAGAQAKVDELDTWQQSEVFNDAERLALEYTEAVTRSDIQVTEDLVARMKECYSEDDLVELTGLIAFQNLSSKFNAALDVPAQGFCRVPGK
jgi:AhpD family alkylhydroperoxidase